MRKNMSRAERFMAIMLAVEDLEREGRQATSYSVARAMNVTRQHRINQMLRILASEGYLSWDVRFHRKNAVKYVYGITNEGRYFIARHRFIVRNSSSGK